MNNNNQSATDKVIFKRVVDTTIKLGLLILLIVWCFDIVSPFIVPVAWATIIAVAIYPLHLKLGSALGNRTTMSASLIAILGLLVFIVPATMLSNSLVDSGLSVAQSMKEGTLVVPLPPEQIAELPLIGDQLHNLWTEASSNMEAFLAHIAPQLKNLSSEVLKRVASAGLGLLQFLASIIISGIFLAISASGRQVCDAIAVRLTGQKGIAHIDMIIATIQSVAQGVLGIAFIQALLGGLGMIVAGVPAAGVWSVVILIVAIAQLPSLIVFLPLIAYVYSVESTMVATIFMVWSILVGLSDNLLKPLLLGRGVEVPMLVILLGAIGGMISSGIIGLFVGAIVLSVSYTLFTEWLQETEIEPTSGE